MIETIASYVILCGLCILLGWFVTSVSTKTRIQELHDEIIKLETRVVDIGREVRCDGHDLAYRRYGLCCHPPGNGYRSIWFEQKFLFICKKCGAKFAYAEKQLPDKERAMLQDLGIIDKPKPKKKAKKKVKKGAKDD